MQMEQRNSERRNNDRGAFSNQNRPQQPQQRGFEQRQQPQQRGFEQQPRGNYQQPRGNAQPRNEGRPAPQERGGGGGGGRLQHEDKGHH